MSAEFETYLAFLQSQWNALIPKHAVTVQTLAHGVRWLHPTKGWRFVSSKRLGYTPSGEPK
jgi:hypothetical protein